MNSIPYHPNNNIDKHHIQKFTLIFVKKSNNLLLGLKKRGFGEGKWNGFGGKVERDESILDGAIRELKEESNLDVNRLDMKYLGYVEYERCSSPEIDIVYIFETCKVSDTFQETEEMLPKWFKFAEIPYESMWPDAKFWLPLVLEGKGLLARFLYGDDEEILAKTINEIDLPELVQ